MKFFTQTICNLNGICLLKFISSPIKALVIALAIGQISWGQNVTQSNFTGVFVPQYMASGNTTRLPMMFRATISGLTANTTYRYYVQGATNSSTNGASVDFGTANSGAGNCLLINTAGTSYTYTTSPSMTMAGNYETFTTAVGQTTYTGWFSFVNSGNGRFTAGNTVFPCIVIGNTSGTVLFRRAMDLGITVLQFSTSAGANNGSFYKGTTSGPTALNIVGLYNNVAGSGRPLCMAPIENISEAIASTPTGYSTTAGNWNAIIPNNNANGVRAIVQYNVASSNTVATTFAIGSNTNASGFTGSVNPRNGTTVATLSSGAPLTTLSSATTGDWFTGATWVGGAQPNGSSTTNTATVSILHAVTLGSDLTNTGIVTVGSGSSFAVAANYTNSGTTNISSGTFQINQGGFGGGSTDFVYSGTTNLIYNYTQTTPYVAVDGTHRYWPSTGPTNVTLQMQNSATVNAGALQMGIARTITGTLSTSNANNRIMTFDLQNFAFQAANITIGVTSNLSLSGAGDITATGNVTVGNSSTFTLSSNSSSQLNLGGNLSVGNATGTGTFASNGRSVFFTGAAGATQVITKNNGGTGASQTFDYLIINGTQNVQISSTPASQSLSLNANTGALQFLNSGALDLNGRSATQIGGTIVVNGTTGGGNKNITSTSTATFNFTTATTTVSSTGSGRLIFGDNVMVLLNNGVDFGNTITIIGSGTAGILQIDTNGFVSTNPPTYASGSTLIYNTANFSRGTEWSTTSGPGYPVNVQIGNGTATTLDIVNSVVSYKRAAGNLIVSTGSTLNISGLTVGNGNVGLEFLGNINNDGTITMSGGTNGRLKAVNLNNGVAVTNGTSPAIVTLSSTIGGDLELTGNYNDNATFTANQRAVFFTGGSNIQTIGGNAPNTFNIDYIVVTKSTAGGSVRLLKNTLTGAPNGGDGITFSSSANDIFDLNGFVFTFGTAAQTCTVSGSGLFRSTSGNPGTMFINGTGAMGTLNFESGNNTLAGLTIDRTAGSGTPGVILGSALNLTTTLALTNTTTLTLGGNLTVSASGNNSVEGIITGTAALVKTGAGTLTLTAASGNNTANTYSGGTTINTVGSGTISVTGLTNITSASIASTAQSVTFSTASPTDGTYQLLPGTLTVGTQNFAHNADPSKVVTFNYTNSTVTVVPTTITTSAISPTTYCTDGSISIPFTSNTALSGTYTAQLSDVNGSFASPVAIGSNTTSPISATIPGGTETGTGYRIRVVNLGNSITGSDNGTNITINSVSTAPTGITGTTTICNGNSTTLTLSGGTAGTGATAEWFTGSCGGTSAGTGNSIMVSPTSNTVYYVRYIGICNTTLCVSATVSVSNNNTWTGGAGTTLWTTPENWSCGLAPTSATDVTIASAGLYPVIASNVTINSLTLDLATRLNVTTGYNLTVTGAIINNGGTFTLHNNANLIQGGTANNNTGNIKVERNTSELYRLDYTLWSTPVTGQELYAFTPYTISNRFYTYNTGSNQYNAVPFGAFSGQVNGVGGTEGNHVPFTTGKGYLIRVRYDWPTYVSDSNPGTPWMGTFEGVPNNGDIPVTLLTSGEPLLGYGYNAVGNPYPSAIDITTFLSDNSSVIDPTLWFWRRRNLSGTAAYITYTSGTFNSGPNNSLSLLDPQPLDLIQSGQGFFVKAHTAGSLQFNNDQRVPGNGTFFKNPIVTNTIDVNRIWLNLSNTGGVVGSMALGYKTGATNGLDDNFDGKFINDSSTSFSLNSLVDATELSVQHRGLPFDTADVVPLSFKTNATGIFNIAINAVDGLFADNAQAIYLKDNLIATYHNLNTGAYSFASEAGTFNGRFEIVYALPLGVDNPVFTANAVIIYPQNNEFVVNSGTIIMSSIKVFDIRGRLLEKKKGINASQTTIANGLTNQVLLVQITSEDGITVTKKVIR